MSVFMVIEIFLICRKLSAIEFNFLKSRIPSFLSNSFIEFRTQFTVIAKKNCKLFGISFLPYLNMTVKNINNFPFVDILTYVSSNIINWCVFHNIVFLSCQDMIVTKTKCNIFVNKQATPRISLSTAQNSKWRNK